MEIGKTVVSFALWELKEDVFSFLIRNFQGNLYRFRSYPGIWEAVPCQGAATKGKTLSGHERLKKAAVQLRAASGLAQEGSSLFLLPEVLTLFPELF